jgi:hypothetical protein
MCSAVRMQQAISGPKATANLRVGKGDVQYLLFSLITLVFSLVLIYTMSESIPSGAVGSGSSIISSKNIAYDPEMPPESSKVLMQVIDALYDGTKPRLRRERTEFDLTESRSLSTDSEFNKESAKFMNNLPAQKPRTARIFDLIVPSRVGITGLKYADAGTAHSPEITSSKDQNDKSRGHILQLDENQAFEWSKVPVEVNDIGSIYAQWSQSLDSKKHVYRLVNCMSLEQHPRNTYLTCVRGSDDRLIGKCLSHDLLCYLQGYSCDSERGLGRPLTLGIASSRRGESDISFRRIFGDVFKISGFGFLSGVGISTACGFPWLPVKRRSS